MIDHIKDYIRAAYPLLYFITHEEDRVTTEIGRIGAALNSRPLYVWDAMGRLVNTVNGDTMTGFDSPPALMEHLLDREACKIPDKALFLLKDFHLFMEDFTPGEVRLLKDLMPRAKRKGWTFIITACRRIIPPELEKEITIVEYDLPSEEQLMEIAENVRKTSWKKLDDPTKKTIAEAALGMTAGEAENAFALSYVQDKKLNPKLISNEKAHAIKKGGILEIFESEFSIDDIGGLDFLKTWLCNRQSCMTDKAREFGLPTPKGILIVGVPGTGKSLTAKATANILERPLLKLDAGRIFGGIVGESESNVRSVQKTCEAIAPAILWIDEVEKAFSGTKSSNATDGGTSSRVFGSFISWMQEKTAPVFVVATANDITQLPPEFIRPGRFDAMFFCDLPNNVEREAIWKIQIRKYQRDPAAYDLAALVEASHGYTGAEIEQAYIDALFESFTASEGDPDTNMVLSCLKNTVPLSRTMVEQITALRKWADGRAKPASTPTSKAPEIQDLRNMDVKFPGESEEF